ncbi:MAG: TRZ/ATZ family hydrolase [Pseudomonadales bacterium]|nr:TRZ/ATZ family hydrolase [Pseudomonadales bacterium]
MTAIPPETVETLLHARWVLGTDDEQPLLEDHCLVLDKGRIVDLLPSNEAGLRYEAKENLRLGEHILMPGLINTHGHAAMSLLRGAADDLPLHTWLQDYIWPMEGRWVSEDFVYDGTQLAIAEMLRSGTTCFADMYFFPDQAARAASEAGMRAQFASPVFDFPSAWGQGASEYIHKTTALNDQYANHPLISFAFGPHAPYTISNEPLEKIVVLAEEMDIPIHMHVHETTQEILDALKTEGRRPLQRLNEIGLVSPRLICVHATQLLDEEIALLAENGASIAHCPESNLKLASGFCPVAKLQQAGVNVALGTDGAASNNDLDMFGEMRTAALLAKAVAGDASALPALQALRMATLNGAKAMGLDGETGSLETGKSADVIAVRLDSLNAIPCYHPLSQLVYSSGSSQVSHVWIAGRLLLDDGELTSIDIERLRSKVMHWQQRIAPDTRH